MEIGDALTNFNGSDKTNHMVTADDGKHWAETNILFYVHISLFYYIDIGFTDNFIKASANNNNQLARQEGHGEGNACIGHSSTALSVGH